MLNYATIIVEFEQAFDDAFFRSVAHQLGAGLATEYRVERAKEDRLTGSGLACYDVETSAELDFDFGDQGEVANEESGQHIFLCRISLRPRPLPRRGSRAGTHLRYRL